MTSFDSASLRRFLTVTLGIYLCFALLVRASGASPIHVSALMLQGTHWLMHAGQFVPIRRKLASVKVGGEPEGTGRVACESSEPRFRLSDARTQRDVMDDGVHETAEALRGESAF